MNFKKSSIPSPSMGSDYSNEKVLVVPDQSISLEEILVRFTRGEAVPVGLEVQEGEDSDNPLNVDLEKLANSDLVDKEEFMGKLVDLQKRYNKQELEKVQKKAAAEKAEFEKKDALRIKRAAAKLAKENSKS